jgi:hypothetical protein
LGKEGRATIIEWIPQGQLTAPKHLLGVMGHRVSKKAKIVMEERATAKEHAWVK